MEFDLANRACGESQQYSISHSQSNILAAAPVGSVCFEAVHSTRLAEAPRPNVVFPSQPLCQTQDKLLAPDDFGPT